MEQPAAPHAPDAPKVPGYTLISQDTTPSGFVCKGWCTYRTYEVRGEPLNNAKPTEDGKVPEAQLNAIRKLASDMSQLNKTMPFWHIADNITFYVVVCLRQQPVVNPAPARHAHRPAHHAAHHAAPAALLSELKEENARLKSRNAELEAKVSELTDALLRALPGAPSANAQPPQQQPRNGGQRQHQQRQHQPRQCQ